MSISEEIREAIRAAKATPEASAGDPFKRILDEVAKGLSDGSVEARVVGAPGGRWTIWVSPAHRPGVSFSMPSVVLSAGKAEVIGQPRQTAATPAELADLLKGFVTTPTFLASLQEFAELASQPVEGFLRVEAKTVSRDDLLLEVAPEVQRQIAESVGRELTLQLPLAKLPFAGTFKRDVPYKVLEAAGYSVTLERDVALEANGTLRIVGRVRR
jgi:hypothetical protein